MMSQLLADEMTEHQVDLDRLQHELQEKCMECDRANETIARMNTELTAALIELSTHKANLTATREALERERQISNAANANLKDALGLMAADESEDEEPPSYELSVVGTDETGKMRKLRLTPIRDEK